MKKHTTRQLRWEFKQKLCGIAFIALSIFILIFATNGNEDATPVVLLLPLGICLTFTKERWF